MNYEMGGTILSKTVKEKDLGVTMNANMKVSEQCRIAASKGNQVLGMIRRNITYCHATARWSRAAGFDRWGLLSSFNGRMADNKSTTVLTPFIVYSN